MKRSALALLRFLVVSVGAFGIALACPSIVLGLPALLAWLLAVPLKIAPLGPPVVHGAVVTFAHAGTPIVLEDPYVLAGIPLHLGLWAMPARAFTRVPWLRVAAGVLGLELLAGITIALVALCVDRGYTVSPAREPLEWVALTLVAAIRVLPLPLWMMLDPAWSKGFAEIFRQRSRPRLQA
jgi:hypothetical protein